MHFQSELYILCFSASIFGGFFIFVLFTVFNIDKVKNNNIPPLKIKCDDHITIPEITDYNNAGIDLRASKVDIIRANKRELVSTGIYMEIPPGYFGRIYPRSGLSINDSIDVGAGVIDSNYRGEIKVLLCNNGCHDYGVRVNDRIAQIIIQPYLQTQIVRVNELSPSNRGNNGFGSSGIS